MRLRQIILEDSQRKQPTAPVRESSAATVPYRCDKCPIRKSIQKHGICTDEGRYTLI